MTYKELFDSLSPEQMNQEICVRGLNYHDVIGFRFFTQAEVDCGSIEEKDKGNIILLTEVAEMMDNKT